MPQIIANGSEGANGDQGFDFNVPAGIGINGQDANCSFWGDDCAQVGGPGGPGVQGGEGGPGGPGGNAGTIDIEVNTFSILVQLKAIGGKGGDGGRGGKGQDGGKGGRGGNGDDCELGRHGGNGGTISVRAKNFADGNTPQIDVSEGGGGRGGDPGTSGLPGAPGDDGTTSGWFVTSNDCEDMGPVPQWGALAIMPNPSSRGNGNNGTSGTASFLQIKD
ncbi:hypothetical protein [Bacillus cereus]|uniref:hypothetical protein n=1 Tax=Bacillus cereus TaxID=1396 RepID=UPI00255A0330|nr:hypothetical protein [Bacillus cereus]